MTVFEYIMVMVSIILALALAQLLRGLTEIPTNRKRYWVHEVWVAVIVFLILQSWWAYWDFNEVRTWTFTVYLFNLVMPIGLFLSAYLLLPVNRDSDFEFKEHFYRIRRWLFLLLLIMHTVGILQSWVLLDIPLTHLYRIFQVALIALVTAGIVFKSHFAQVAVLGTYVAILIISQIVIRMELGALT